MPMKTTHAEGYAYGSISDVSFNNNNNSSNNSSNNNNDHRSNVERLGHCSNMEGHHHSSFYSRQRHLSVEDSPVKEIKEGVSSESFPNGYAININISLCLHRRHGSRDSLSNSLALCSRNGSKIDMILFSFHLVVV